MAGTSEQVREHTGAAVIVQHCSVFGTIRTPVRQFKVEDVRPYAQHKLSVTVAFLEPRKRTWCLFTMVPDGTRYLTIEVGGSVVYDSRAEVPCDMAKWEETWARFKDRRPFTITHV